MPSKQRHEGYLLIDNRFSPGVSEDEARRLGNGYLLPTAPEGKMFESATVTCNHCCRVVVLRPDRSRSRTWCRKCDHYVCDMCAPAVELMGHCQTVNAQADATMAGKLILPC